MPNTSIKEDYIPDPSIITKAMEESNKDQADMVKRTSIKERIRETILPYLEGRLFDYNTPNIHKFHQLSRAITTGLDQAILEARKERDREILDKVEELDHSGSCITQKYNMECTCGLDDLITTLKKK